ncbi:MAG: hypothetical protein ABGZ53_10770 [Fuerstiella sp.]
MKPFFVLLFPLVLVGCGSETPPSPNRGNLVATIDDPEPAPDASVTSPTTPADAVAAIEELGGEFVLDPKSGEVIEVRLDGTQITDKGLVSLNGLTSMTTLYLSDTQVTDAGLEHLKDLISLNTVGSKNCAP